MKGIVIEENIDRGISVLLATTTWLFIFPSVNEKFGVKIAIAACVATALVEFTGYYSRLMGARTGSMFLASYGFVILMASATLSLWGGILQKAIITSNGYDGAIAKANKEYQKILDKKEAEVLRLEQSRKDFNSRIDKEKRSAMKAYRSSLISQTSNTFAKRWIDGSYMGWYRDNRPGYIEVAQAEKRKYEAEVRRINQKTYTAPVAIDYSSTEKGIAELKKANMDAVRLKANSLRNIIIIIDILGGFLGIFRFIKSLGPGSNCDRPSMSISLISSMEYTWSSIAASFAPPPVEQWGVRPKRKDVSYYHEEELSSVHQKYQRMLSNMHQEIEALNRSNGQLIEAVEAKSKQIEAVGSKQSKQSIEAVEAKIEAVTVQPTDTEGDHIEAVLSKQSGKKVLRFRGKIWDRTKIRSNWKDAIRRYSKQSYPSDLSRIRTMWKLWKELMDFLEEDIKEEDKVAMQPYLPKQKLKVS